MRSSSHLADQREDIPRLESLKTRENEVIEK